MSWRSIQYSEHDKNMWFYSKPKHNKNIDTIWHLKLIVEPVDARLFLLLMFETNLAHVSCLLLCASNRSLKAANWFRKLHADIIIVCCQFGASPDASGNDQRQNIIEGMAVYPELKCVPAHKINWCFFRAQTFSQYIKRSVFEWKTLTFFTILYYSPSFLTFLYVSVKISKFNSATWWIHWYCWHICNTCFDSERYGIHIIEKVLAIYVVTNKTYWDPANAVIYGNCHSYDSKQMISWLCWSW